MPFILEERADRRPNFCTAVLNYSIRVVGDNAVIPEFPVRDGQLDGDIVSPQDVSSRVLLIPRSAQSLLIDL
jgi:hypothetical protein